MNGLEYDVHSNILLYRCYFFKKIMSSSMSLHVVFPFSLFLSEIIVYIYTDFDFCDFRDFLPNRFLIPLIIFLFFFWDFEQDIEKHTSRDTFNLQFDFHGGKGLEGKIYA